MKKIALLAFVLVLFNCNAQEAKKSVEKHKIKKTEAQWKQELTKQQYYVLRKAGTERAFSSKLNKEHRAGIYLCAACKSPLFKSEHKFNSGTGWPSFDRAIKGNVNYAVDYNLGSARTEEHCANCGGHLGHVFNDGPTKTTGKRHCINGVALQFSPLK